MTTLKLQYGNFETGEFTEEKSIDKESLLELFEQNTEIVPLYSTYTIKRPLIKFFVKTRENYLCVKHFAKDAFTVWYCNDLDKKVFEGNFYKESVIKILELFIDSKFDELDKFIPRTTKSKKALIKEFIAIDFIYAYKRRGVFFLIFYSVLSSPLYYIFLSFIFLVHNRSFVTIKLLLSTATLFLVLSVFPIANLFLFRLYFNYTKHSKNISIKVSSGSANITIYNETEIVEFTKDEIKILLQYFGAGVKSPFALYSFSRIILNDNRVFDISYMIIDPYELQLKLSKVPTKRIDKFYPYIKNYRA